jgi:hypothetical protein
MPPNNKSSSQSPSAIARSPAVRNRSPSIKDSSRAESKNKISLRRQTRESVEKFVLDQAFQLDLKVQTN